MRWKCAALSYTLISLHPPRFWEKIKYKEKHNSNLKGHYEGIDRKTMHAMKARKLASDVSLTQHKQHIPSC